MSDLPETWWHWSQTGQLVADPLHAGTMLAALHRGKHLRGVTIKMINGRMYEDMASSSTGAPTPSLYHLRLTEPIANPKHPAIDMLDWTGWRHQEPVLYLNDYEGKVRGSEERQYSVIAPLGCWEVLEVVHDMERRWRQFEDDYGVRV